MRQGRRREQEIAHDSGEGRLRQGANEFAVSYEVRTTQPVWEIPAGAGSGALETRRGIPESTGKLSFLGDMAGLSFTAPTFLRPDGGQEVEILFTGRIATGSRTLRFHVNADWQAAVGGES